MLIKIFSLMLAFGALLLAPALFAQTQRSGGGETQKILQQYQQIAAEKTALQGQLAQAQKDLDSAKAQLAAMKKERDMLKAHVGGSTAPAAAVAQLTAAKESAERTAETRKQRLTELVARFRETATNLRDVEADRTKLHKDLDERNSAYDKCAENNLQLYEISSDVLNRYERVGVFTKISATEPFTKITRTRIENLVDEDRTRAQALRAKKRSP